MASASQDPLENFVDGIISALFQGGEIAAETFATAQVPILANPLLQTILDDLISFVANSVEKNLLNSVNALVYDFQTNGENSVVMKAAGDLENNQSSGDQSAILKSVQTLISGYANLIHSDGGGIPPTTP